jgi:hypothetical protein
VRVYRSIPGHWFEVCLAFSAGKAAASRPWSLPTGQCLVACLHLLLLLQCLVGFITCMQRSSIHLCARLVQGALGNGQAGCLFMLCTGRSAYSCVHVQKYRSSAAYVCRDSKQATRVCLYAGGQVFLWCTAVLHLSLRACRHSAGHQRRSCTGLLCCVMFCGQSAGAKPATALFFGPDVVLLWTACWAKHCVSCTDRLSHCRCSTLWQV